MRLDAVYVLAPKPKPPSMPTRRAMLITGACSLAAAATGFSAGWIARGTTVDARSGADEQPTEDALQRIRWAEALAAESTGRELLDHLPAFGSVLHEAATLGLDSSLLWEGVRRAAAALLADERSDSRAVRARAILSLLDLRSDDALEALREDLLRAARR